MAQMEQRRTTLAMIPTNTVLKIFMKMPTVEVVKMRRTCSWVNKFVDDNQKKLASRPECGIYLKISYEEANQTVRFHTTRRRTVARYPHPDFQKQMAGISIKYCQVMAPARKEIGFYFKLHEALKNVELVCGAFFCLSVPIYLFGPITDDVTVPVKEFFLYHTTVDIKSALGVLKLGKKRSKFTIVFEGPSMLENNIFDWCQYFGRIELKTTWTGVFELLWDIYYELDDAVIPEMKEILCTFDGTLAPRDFPFSDDIPASFRTLQKLTGVNVPDDELMRFHCIDFPNHVLLFAAYKKDGESVVEAAILENDELAISVFFECNFVKVYSRILEQIDDLTAEVLGKKSINNV